MAQNNSVNFAGIGKYTVSSSAANGSYTTIQYAASLKTLSFVEELNLPR
jgi:hypothetical protein